MMKLAYVVCLVALLQVSLCQSTEDSTQIPTDASTEPPILVETALNDTSTIDAGIDSTNGTEPTSTESVEDESMAYTAVTESSSAVQEDTSTATSQPSPRGHATLLHPTAFAVIVPLCIRLFSTKLTGDV